MSFFPLRRKQKNDLIVAGFLGSSRLDALVCVVNPRVENTQGVSDFEIKTRGGVEKIIKKLHFDYPLEHPERAISFFGNILRETIAAYGIPARAVLGFCSGERICKESLASWNIRPRHAHGALSQNTLRLYFRNAFEQHRKKDCMTIACPVSVAANGYACSPFLLSGKHAQELTLRAIITSFTDAVAEPLLSLKESFGGIAFDCVPAAVAYECVLTHAYKSRESLAIDAANERTTLFIIRNGVIDALVSFEHPPMEKMRMEIRGGAQWKTLFLSALDAIFHTGALPGDIYIFGNMSRALAPYLVESSWISDFSHEKKARIRAVSGSNIFGGESFNGFLHGHADARLASLLYYAVKHIPLF